jgi:hypothetical protein
LEKFFCGFIFCNQTLKFQDALKFFRDACHPVNICYQKWLSIFFMGGNCHPNKARKVSGFWEIPSLKG